MESPAADPLVRNLDARKFDWLPLALTLLGFFALTFLTLHRLPFTWIDEVLLAEPGINLATGHGYTSAAWQTSGRDEFFASPYPLYSFIVAGWVKIAGISETSVRLLPVVLTALALVLIWWTARRLQLVVTTRARVWLCLLIICDYGYAFSYRSGRPEALDVFLCAVMFYSFALNARAARYAVLGACAFLIPFVGLHVVAYCLLVSFALVLFRPREFWKEAVLVAVGMGLGQLTFVGYYHWLGIWPAFQRELAFHGSTNLFERVRERLTSNPLHNHSIIIPKDFSMMFFGLAMIWTTIALWRRQTFTLRSLAFFGLLLTFVVSAGLYFGLRFSTYYSWMVAVPVAVIYNAIWSRADFASRPQQRWIAALQVGACLLGLPLQMAVAAYDWKERDPAITQRLADAHVRPDDVVYCDYCAYFPVKLKALRVYMPKYLLRITPAEAAEITVAFVSPHPTLRLDMTTEQQLDALGGGWTKVGEYRPTKLGLLGNDWQWGYMSTPNYALEVYRRPPSTR